MKTIPTTSSTILEMVKSNLTYTLSPINSDEVLKETSQKLNELVKNTSGNLVLGIKKDDDDNILWEGSSDKLFYIAFLDNLNKQFPDANLKGSFLYNEEANKYALLIKYDKVRTKGSRIRSALTPTMDSVFKTLTPIAILIASFYINQGLQNNPQSKKSIILGFTNFTSIPKDTQLSHLKSSITEPANSLLGKSGEKYQFFPTIVGTEYKAVINALYHDRVDVAFFSPYLYVQTLKDTATYQAIYDELELIGFKYTYTGLWYHSGIIVRKKDNIDNLDEFLSEENIEKIKNDTFIVGTNPSASTKAIPELFMATFLDSGYHLKEMDRDKLVKLLVEQVNYKNKYGFLSSDDWIDLIKVTPIIESLYDFIKIDNFPIPYDPVFVNRKKWNGRFSNYRPFQTNDENVIIEALRTTICRMEGKNNTGNKNSWIENNSIFMKLVYSGVITKVDSNGSLTIRFINDDAHKRYLKSFVNELENGKTYKIGQFQQITTTEMHFKYPLSFKSLVIIPSKSIHFSKNQPEIDKCEITAMVNPATLKKVNLLHKYFLFE